MNHLIRRGIVAMAAMGIVGAVNAAPFSPKMEDIVPISPLSHDCNDPSANDVYDCNSRYPILGAYESWINKANSPEGELVDTHNQNGLSQYYQPFVTPFEAFVRETSHSYVFDEREWRAEEGSVAAGSSDIPDFVEVSVTYRLGALPPTLLLDDPDSPTGPIPTEAIPLRWPIRIDAFALWNEDLSGIGVFDLLVSVDNVNFYKVLENISPTDNELEKDYYSEHWHFGPVKALYVRLDMWDCPQSNSEIYNGCGIGEVAFRAVPKRHHEAPEPGSLALIAAGLAVAGAFGRRRRRS